MAAITLRHRNRSRMNSSGSGGAVTAAESVGLKPAGSLLRRRACLSASAAFAHKTMAVAAKTTKKSPAFAPIVIQKTCG